MQFGVSFVPDSYPELKTPVQYFSDALNIVEQIDRLGFHSVKITEHFFHPYGGYCGNPITFLTAAAMRSQHLRLVTGCVLPVFHNPINIASELAMLDAISGGRAEAGFARAYLPYEFEAFGVPMDESRARFTEFIDAITRLWSEENVTFSGKFNNFKGITSMPPVVQRPHPPVWIAASATPESFEWTGRRGYNLMIVPIISDFEHFKHCLQIYRQAHQAAGHGTVGPEKITLVYPLYVNEDRDAAHAIGKAHMQRHWQVWCDAASSWNSVSSSQYQNYTGMGEYLKTFTYKQMVDERRILVGTPAEIIESIQHIRDAYGVEYLTFQVDFGGMELSLAQRSLDLFGQSVMPQFSDHHAEASAASALRRQA